MSHHPAGGSDHIRGRVAHGRADKADNLLLDVETQARWLRGIGFEHADCCFQWLELAVFGGMKPL